MLESGIIKYGDEFMHSMEMEDGIYLKYARNERV
jgi:hypothetical protein